MRKFFPVVLASTVFAILLWTLPAQWCKRGSEEWFSGNRDTQESLARTVALQVERSLTTSDFHTKSELFNGEWLFGTYLMSGIGLCQIVRQHPETFQEWQPVIGKCIRQLLSPAVREFDLNSWRSDALESLNDNQGHAAYLGYLNFLLGLYREIHPSNEFVPLNDSITAALIRRTAVSPNGLIATYPNEWYPVDNAPVLASIALHARATGQDYSQFLSRQEHLFRRQCIDPATGLLIQAINGDGSLRDTARGSGSTLGLFFLSHVYPKLGAGIFTGIRKQLAGGILNFGAIREYPRGVDGGRDIDSGPIVFGFSFSASGFAISNARAYGDRGLFSSLYASAILAGAPIRNDNHLDFLTAGPLGNAILLAMLTAPSVTQ